MQIDIHDQIPLFNDGVVRKLPNKLILEGGSKLC